MQYLSRDLALLVLSLTTLSLWVWYLYSVRRTELNRFRGSASWVSEWFWDTSVLVCGVLYKATGGLGILSLLLCVIRYARTGQ